MSNTRIPPNSREAEESLLGCLLVGSKYIEEAVSSLRPEMFYYEDLRTIMRAIITVHSRDLPVDIKIVTAELKRMGESPSFAIQVMDLSSVVSSDINVAAYAQIVIQKYINREAIRMSQGIQDAAMSDDLDEVISQTTTMGDALLNNIPTVNSASISEIFAQNAKSINERAAGKGVKYIDFGIRAIDRILGGAGPGDLIVIGGRPSMGKTALALQIAYNMSALHPILYFTLEMTREEIGNRYLVALTDIDSIRIKRGENITATEWRLIEEAGSELESRQIIVDDSIKLSIYNIRSKVYRMVRAHGVKVVFIDYLQLMGGPKGKDGSEYYGAISMTCKQLAKELRISIILLSQLNRDVEKRGEKIPRMFDLRESGNIEQDADTVIFPVRCDRAGIEDPSKGLGPGKAIISIAKNRNGMIDNVVINVSSNAARWWDERDYPPAPRENVPPPFQID